MTDAERTYLKARGWSVCSNGIGLHHFTYSNQSVRIALRIERDKDAAVEAALEKAAVRVLDAAKRMEAMDDFGLEPTWESTLKTYGPRKFVGLFIGTVAQSLAAHAMKEGQP